jgi:hypothetical protein
MADIYKVAHSQTELASLQMRNFSASDRHGLRRSQSRRPDRCCPVNSVTLRQTIDRKLTARRREVSIKNTFDCINATSAPWHAAANWTTEVRSNVKSMTMSLWLEPRARCSRHPPNFLAAHQFVISEHKLVGQRGGIAIR